jgi:hypothetical protein
MYGRCVESEYVQTYCKVLAALREALTEGTQVFEAALVLASMCLTLSGYVLCITRLLKYVTDRIFA